MAERLNLLGHDKIVYLTYSRASRAEAESRFKDYVQVKTLHSEALKLVSSLENSKIEVLEEHEFNARVEDWVADRVQRELVAIHDIKTKRTFAKKMILYIRKTLEIFLNSYSSPANFNSIYFPAKKFHEKSVTSTNFNFNFFYVYEAMKLWSIIVSSPYRSFDCLAKQAQLGMYRIDASALLVDESQDLNGCMLAWLIGQRRFQTHITLVGDAAQSIYSFRGARSELMLELRDCADANLTVMLCAFILSDVMNADCIYR